MTPRALILALALVVLSPVATQAQSNAIDPSLKKLIQHAVGAPGIYRGLDEAGNPCRFQIESQIWVAPETRGTYRADLGVVVSKPEYNSMIRNFLVWLGGGIDPTSEITAPGHSILALRAKLAVYNGRWTDQVELVLSSRSHGVNANAKDSRAISIEVEKGPEARYRARSSEQNKKNPQHYTRVSMRGSVAKGKILDWVELARKDSPERLKDFPRLRSLQNQLRCRNLTWKSTR